MVQNRNVMAMSTSGLTQEHNFQFVLKPTSSSERDGQNSKSSSISNVLAFSKEARKSFTSSTVSRGSPHAHLELISSQKLTLIAIRNILVS